MAIHFNILSQQMSMDRGVWQSTVHEVTKSQIRLSDQHFHFHFQSHKRCKIDPHKKLVEWLESGTTDCNVSNRSQPLVSLLLTYWGKYGKICKSWAERREEGEQGKLCVYEGYFLSLRLRLTFILGVEGYNKYPSIKRINHLLFEQQIVKTGKII